MKDSLKMKTLRRLQTDDQIVMSSSSRNLKTPRILKKERKKRGYHFFVRIISTKSSISITLVTAEVFFLHHEDLQPAGAQLMHVCSFSSRYALLQTCMLFIFILWLYYTMIYDYTIQWLYYTMTILLHYDYIILWLHYTIQWLDYVITSLYYDYTIQWLYFTIMLRLYYTKTTHNYTMTTWYYTMTVLYNAMQLLHYTILSSF